MKRETSIRHRLGVAGLFIFLGFWGVFGCTRPYDRTSDPYMQPTRPTTQPAIPQTQPSSSRNTLPAWVGRAWASTAADEGRDVGSSRGVIPGTGASLEKATGPAVVQSIREALQADPGFSPQAKAIQVTAEKGIIILRGNVATQREKGAVAVKAQQIAGNAFNVDNQLMVPAR